MFDFRFVILLLGVVLFDPIVAFSDHFKTVADFEAYFATLQDTTFSSKIEERCTFHEVPTNPFGGSDEKPFKPDSMSHTNQYCLNYLGKDGFDYFNSRHSPDFVNHCWISFPKTVFYRNAEYQVYQTDAQVKSKNLVDAELHIGVLEPIIFAKFLFNPAVCFYQPKQCKVMVSKGGLRKLIIQETSIITVEAEFDIKDGIPEFLGYKRIMKNSRIYQEVRVLASEKFENVIVPKQWEYFYFPKSELYSSSAVSAHYGETCNLQRPEALGVTHITRTKQGDKVEYLDKTGKLISLPEAEQRNAKAEMKDSSTTAIWVAIGLIVGLLILVLLKRSSNSE